MKVVNVYRIFPKGGTLRQSKNRFGSAQPTGFSVAKRRTGCQL